MIRLTGEALAAIVKAFSEAAYYRQDRTVLGVSIHHEAGSDSSSPWWNDHVGAWMPGDLGEATETTMDFDYVSEIHDEDGDLVDGDYLALWFTESFAQAGSCWPTVTVQDGHVRIVLDHDEDGLAA